MKLSIIIPSYKDPLLLKTTESLLENSELPIDEMEIIIVLDGYWTSPIDDPRVKVVHLGKNGGMRNAINIGVKVSTGEYIMRVDEHQVFGKGYDRILLQDIEDNWIVTPRRYFLDVVKWEVMDIEPIDNEKLMIDNTRKKFTAVKQRDLDKKTLDVKIAEKTAMQGSCWIMKRTWWDKVIGELQSEGYGTHYQDSIEMLFKTWQAGGKLMVNKNTWHAHKHRDFPRTHNYGGALADASFKYALDTWGDYYHNVIKPKWKI